MNNDKIRIERINHRGEKRVAIFFDYDRRIIELVKEITGRKYSHSRKCWHFPDNEESFHLLEKLREQIISNLEKKGENRLCFKLPKEAFKLRKTIKIITNSRWHVDEKQWSIPDTEINQAFLKEKNIPFKLDRKNIFPNKMEKQIKRKESKKDKKYEKKIPFETMKAINKFKEWMRQRRYSESTIKSYLSFVLHFFSVNWGKGWDEIEMKDIIDYNYKKFILGKQSYSAQNQFINAIKLFYQFQGKGKVVPGEIERPRKEKHLPDVLTKEDIASIIRCASNIKHKCLLAFVYGGGLRIGEALELKLRDIRVEEKLLYIRMAKGKKDRRVPLSQKMMELYRDYRASHLPQNYLFEGQKGGKYSRTSAARVLQKCIKKAGIDGSITLHTLRHSYATHLMESGVGLRYIQEILGHSSPKTTMIYTHISGKRLSEIKSPLDDLGI